MLLCLIAIRGQINEVIFRLAIGRVSKYYACYRHSTVEYMTEIIYYRPCDGVTKNSVHDRHPIGSRILKKEVSIIVRVTKGASTNRQGVKK